MKKGLRLRDAADDVRWVYIDRDHFALMKKGLRRNLVRTGDTPDARRRRDHFALMKKGLRR